MDIQNKKVQVAILEDEEPAARLFKSMILSLRPNWEVICIGGSNEEAENWFRECKQQPDILFSDIELSDGNSFDFIERVHPESMIVFVTAYDEYALRAFSVDSIDYLLKPIDIRRLEESIGRFERLSSTYFKKFNQQNDWKRISERLGSSEKKYRTRFLISRGNQLETLHVENVAYFFSENKICYAQTFSEGSFILDFSLERLGEELDPDIFFRTTRQTLVCTRAITKIENYFQGKVSVFVTPAFKEQILVSKEKAESFKRWLNY
ncbi:MAG: LytTR family DNA-binding domain-containing protein [Bacteroidales bacterium]